MKAFDIVAFRVSHKCLCANKYTKFALSFLFCFCVQNVHSESLMFLYGEKPIKIYADSVKADCVAIIQDSKEFEQ